MFGLQGNGGPVLLFDEANQYRSLVISPYDNFLASAMAVADADTAWWSVGISGEVKSLPAGYVIHLSHTFALLGRYVALCSDHSSCTVGCVCAMCNLWGFPLQNRQSLFESASSVMTQK